MSFKIFFSPSESKIFPKDFGRDSLLDLPFVSPQALQSYLSAIESASEEKICAILGSKRLDLDELARIQNLYNAPRIESIRLYDGVAYGALDFENLELRAQKYLYERVYIFSNLFGALKANDKIPYYNLHQGKGFGDFELKKIYQDTKWRLDEEFSQSAILDLRAQAYIKVYKPDNVLPSSYYQIEFLKNGKKVSHYAKFYRGIYLKVLAELGVENLEDLSRLEIEGLDFVNKQIIKNATILTYEVQE